MRRHATTTILLAAFTAAVTAAPDGFKVEVFSDKVKNPTAICFDDGGGLYVTETFRFRRGVEDNRNHKYWIMEDLATDTTEQRVAYYQKYLGNKIPDLDYFTRHSERVVLLADPDGDGKADTPKVFAEGFNAIEDGPAIGILADKGRVLMACIPHIWELQDKDGDGVSEARSKMISGLGIKTSLSGHDLHGLVWGPDRKLYFSLGDRGYNVTTKEGVVLKNTNSGAAFRCNPDGSKLEVFYHNLRNPQEIAFNEFGDLFTVDNNCDQGDQSRVCYLIEGGDAGWSIGTQALTTYKASIKDGGMNQRPHWLIEGVWKTRHEGSPQYHLPPMAYLTNGPSGMCFNSGTAMPERYRNHFLVCDYKGAPHRCFLYSFKVTQDGAGYVMEDAHQFHGGVPNTDVEIGYDGKIYIADFGGGWSCKDRGNIYTIDHPEARGNEIVKGIAALFKNGFPEDPEKLFELLSHPDMRVRQRAQFELVEIDDPARPDQFAEFAKTKPAPGCYHAIWGLRQLGEIDNDAADALVGLTRHDDAEIRAQAIRALGDLSYGPAINAVVAGMASDAPRVRSFSAIAAGNIGDRAAIPAVVKMLLKNDHKDLNERHAGIYALQHLMGDADVDPLARHQSTAIRLAACLALRRQLNPRLADFLEDEDPVIAQAAIRACNDLEIPGAIEALAAFSKRHATGNEGTAPSEILFRRLINANVRAGQPERATNLVALAANTNLPEKHRVLCLKALETFAAPEPIDPTLGIHRPLAKRDEAAIRAAIQKPLLALFEASEGSVAAGVTRLVSVYELDLDPAKLVGRVRDAGQPPELRIAALERLAINPEFKDEAVFLGALDDPAPKVRGAAVAVWAKRYPGRAIEGIDKILARDTDLDRRAAFRLLAEIGGSEAEARLAAGLDALIADKLPPSLQLDLYESASRLGGSKLKAKLAAVEAWLAKNARSAFHFTLEGGDPERGRAVFDNQGLCLKCHKADRGGGDAGPALTTIASARPAEEILTSLLDPNNQIVPGFGTASVTLKNGTTLTGSPLGEEGGNLKFKAATGKQMTIPLSTIAERSPEVSAMPPMVAAGILSKQDTRDLMAYLLTLKEQR